MRTQNKAKLLLAVLVVTIGMLVAFLTPSVSFAESDQASDDTPAVEAPAETGQTTDGGQADAPADEPTGEAKDGADQVADPATNGTDQVTEPATEDTDQATEPEKSETEDESKTEEPAKNEKTLLANPTKGGDSQPKATASYSDITMRVVEVNGKAVDPVITYLANNGDLVTLEAKTKAPSEQFALACCGILNGETVTVTDAKGNPVQVEARTAMNGAGIVILFDGVEAGTELTVRISGKVVEDNYSLREAWECVFYPDPTITSRPTPIGDQETMVYKGTAICHLARPRLALVVQDKDGNDLCPKYGMADSFALQYMLYSDRVGSSGGTSSWQYIVQQGGPCDKLAEYVEAFVLKDSNGVEVARFTPEEGIACKFDKLGTYTLDVICKAGKTLDFTPVTIEVGLVQPKRGEAILPFPQTNGNNGSLVEVMAPSGYQFKVNGKTIPTLKAQELKTAMLTMTIGAGPMQPAPSVALPAEMSATSTAIGMISVDLQSEQPDAGGLTMKIVKDASKVDATTASYKDPVTWETTVKLDPRVRLDGLIVELRYDVNNQSYPTGSGVQPLFDYGKNPTMKFVLSDGTEVNLTAGTDFTVESPEGYFEVNKTYVDGEPVTVRPNDFNGYWWSYWYEPLANIMEGSNVPESFKPYFLHPYFQKQVLKITEDPEVLNALYQKIGDKGVRSVVVTNTGTLSEYAFTGGYGNPARALAFGKMPMPEPKSRKSLDPNQSELPSYYLKSSRYTNIGFDATVVYTSAMTVHKVDENKKDLKGAEFTLTDSEGKPTNAKAIQGQATHLVLSHFIPGFSLVRPVPDSVDEVSRRNLTSIGEPALKSTNPKGDPVGDDAYLTYAGLKEGSYVITETKAPTGYKSGQELNVELTAAVPSKIVSGYEFCRWDATINGKPVAIVEQLADEYPDVDEDAYQFFSCNSSFIVMRVTNEPNKISVKKVWEDADNAQGKRPTSVKVQLYSQDGKNAKKVAYGKPVTLDGSNKWSHTWEKIDETKIWTVEELDVPDGYTVKITGSAEDGFTATNTIEPTTTEVSAKKVWEDDDNAEGKRPESIKVQLYSQDSKDAKKVAYGDPVTLDDSNKWTHTWKELDASKVWTVEELEVPEGYTVEVTGSAEKGFVITNTYNFVEPPKTEVSVEKVWKDNKDEAHKRPTSVKVQLYSQDGKDAKKVAFGKPVTLDEKSGWSHTWKGLDGTKNWTVEEVSVPKGYTAKVTGSAKGGFTITNTYKKVLPKTGDMTPVQAMWMLAGLAVAAFATSTVVRKKDQR